MLATVEGSNITATVSYIHTDHLTGSAVVTNSSGGQTQLLDYNPWGTIRLNNQLSSFNEKRKFAGHEYDTETGLSYMQARYYDSGTGRFVSEDPVFLALPNDKLPILLTDPQRWNSYAYGRNNPLAYRDPDGNWSFQQVNFFVAQYGQYQRFVGDLLTLGTYSIGFDMIDSNVAQFSQTLSLVDGIAAFGSIPAAVAAMGTGAFATGVTLGELALMRQQTTSGRNTQVQTNVQGGVYGRSGNYIPEQVRGNLSGNVRNSLNAYENNRWQKIQGLEKKIYRNDEGYLPGGQTYHEFDVNHKIGATRDAQRFYRGDTDGSVFYTDTHMGSSEGTLVNKIK